MKTLFPLLAALSTLPGIALAQPYPTRPIRVIIGFPPGGGIDIVGRTLAPRLSEILGQPVVIDNRAGANGIVGTNLAAKSTPDGHTVFLGTIGNLSVNPLLHAKLPFNVERDFAPVTHVASVVSVLMVHPSFPGKNVAELIVAAKSRPGAINFSSSGNGGAPHLAGELFNLLAGVKLTHVPYQGTSPALVAVVGGHVQATFGALLTGVPLIKQGKLRGLATLSRMRSALLPDLPTVAETLPGYEVINWYGMVTPMATPKPVIAQLHRAVVKVLGAPEVRENLLAQGANPVGSSPEEFGVFMRSEAAKWAQVIKAADIKVE